MNDALLRLQQLTIRHGETPLVRGLDLEVRRGGCTALVGESGAGKSMVLQAIAGLLPPELPAEGAIIFDGVRLDLLPASARRKWLGRYLGVSFQEASRAFNPVYRIATHLKEAIAAAGVAQGDMKAAVEGALARVGFAQPGRVARAYPDALSGGMKQRAMLAVALAGNPSLLLADEPASAQDPLTRRRLKDLLVRLVREEGLALLLVTHELSLLPGLADRMVVLLEGQMMEDGPAEDVLREPAHPYTRLLLASHPGRNRPGEPLPVPEHRTLSGHPCPFAGRCQQQETCRAPELRSFADGRRRVRCGHGA